MKLYTLIDQPFDEVKAELLTDGDTTVDRMEQLEHDAAAAHALVSAMGEFERGRYSGIYTAAMIRDRAAELMREWGFGEGE